MPKDDEPTADDMAPLSAILNPIDTKKGKVLSFSSSKKHTLTVQQRFFHNLSPGRVVGYGVNESTAPVLADTSSLVAMVVDHALCVYGITGNSGNYKATLVSPGFEPLHQSLPTTTSIAGFGVMGRAYLYYQSVVNSIPCLKEFTFEFEKPTEVGDSGELSKAKFLSGTRLAAARSGFNEDDETPDLGNLNRWVAYQASDLSIHIYNANHKQDTAISQTMPEDEDTTCRAKPKTPLAVCITPGTDTLSETFYVYYVDNNDYVCVVSSPITDGYHLSFEEEAKRVYSLNAASTTKSVKIRRWSEIAVLPNPKRVKNGKPKPSNLLFVVRAGDAIDNVTQVECDEWK